VDAIEWHDPWRPVTNELTARRLQHELRRETARPHALHGHVAAAIAQRIDNDDVLFAVDGRLAVVHLTWSASSPEDPSWPSTRFFINEAEFSSICVMPDHQQYTNSDDIEATLGASGNNTSVARLRLSQLAALVHARVQAQSLGWPETGALMVGNMARMARAISGLSDEFCYDAAILTRSLFEHAVKFAWICAKPSDHFEQWKRADLLNRQKAVNDAQAVGIAEIADISVPEPSEVVGIPSLTAMCDVIDAFWLPQLPGGVTLKRYSFRGWYVGIYRHFSAATHGEGLAVQTLVSKSPAGLVQDFSARTFEPAFKVAPFIFAMALFVSSRTFGGPTDSDILAAFGESSA